MGCLKIKYDIVGKTLAKKWKIFERGLEKNASAEKNRINYYPFGMPMPGRSFSSENYRYGFGGHEKDDEVAGQGNHLSFGDYGYSPRIGRRWNVDPLIKEFPHISPYAVFANNPIYYVDPNGLAPIPGDPVKNPKIRSTDNSGKKGGMFGMTRLGGKQFHNGVDILAPRGTALKSIKAGEVFSKGQHDKLGNFVIIKSNLDDGRTLFTAYAHLDQPTSLDYNQDIDEGGEIGKAGRTGNAKNISVDEEHVHIYTKMSEDGRCENSEFTDPTEFFDTKFNEVGEPINKTASGKSNANPDKHSNSKNY